MAEKSDIQRVLGQIIGNYERRKRGEYNSIPFHIPKLNRVVPGIVPGLHYLITADTKIGKSKFCRQMFILKPAAWAKAK
jgi:predicted ATP-dependent serine protease